MQDNRPHSGKPATAPIVRLSLERWGITEEDMAAMLRCLNDCDGRFEWSAHDSGEPTDLVVHVVDLEGLAGPSHAATWNLMGPVEALRVAREKKTPAIALVRGQARQLPSLRSGCWVVSGRRNLLSAARILAGAAIVPAPGESAQATRQRMIDLASLNAVAVLHRAVAASAQALAATLHALLESTGQGSYAMPMQAYIGVGPDISNGLATDSMLAVQVLSSQPTDTEADVMLAYPWPDLYGMG